MRVSKSSLHDSTHCASCSGLIMLCFVVKSNQTSLYDTILNPIHTWKFIIRVLKSALPSPCSISIFHSLYVPLETCFSICSLPQLCLWPEHTGRLRCLLAFRYHLSVLHPVSFPCVPSSVEPASSTWILLTACYSGSLGLVCSPM